MTPSVLYVITDSGVGGTEKALLQLLQGLHKSVVAPCAVLVLKSKREMAVEWALTGVPVFQVGLKGWPTPAFFVRFMTLLNQHQPAIVHAFLYHSIQTTRLAKLFGASFKLVTSPRVNYRFAPRLALAIDKTLKRFDDLTVCESEAGRKSLVDNLGYDPKKTAVAWNCVDPGTCHFDPVARARIRAEWGVSDSEILIGAVGRLHRQKGFDILLKAIKQLSDARVRHRVVIMGHGPEDIPLKNLSSQLGMPVIFAGERRDIPQALSALDIYVQSSRYEGLSNALLEAMSIGLPCVATAVDGTLDFSRDGENMLLVRPEDEVSLAAGLGLLLERPGLRKKLAENATIAAREFSVERMVQGFEQAYRSVLSPS